VCLSVGIDQRDSGVTVELGAGVFVAWIVIDVHFRLVFKRLVRLARVWGGRAMNVILHGGFLW
jgi:hypothetical protein